MSNLVKILSNANSLKKATNLLTIKELEAVKTRVESVIDRRRSEEESLAQAQKKKSGHVARIREIMKRQGISVTDLGRISLGKRPKSKLPPKYELTTKEGVRVTWSGRGRMPTALRARLDAGEKIESFLISS